MADRSTQLLLDALSRAAADPAGVPLYAGKSGPGLFPATAAARLAAQRCKDEDLIKVVRTEPRGRAVQEVCALTDKGLAYLLGEASPRRLVEDLVRGIEARQGQLAELVRATREAQSTLEAFRELAAKALQQLNQHGSGPPPSANGADDWTTWALACLVRRQDAGAAQDCPLPELYQAARQVHPKLTLGEFHDGLRRLREQGRIYLHPWTGPLYDLPEPACALLVGHEVAYYASMR